MGLDSCSIFAFAWFVTLILWGRQKHHIPSERDQYKITLNELHKSCMQANPQQARDALFKWARLHWPDASILNLTDLTRRSTHAAFKNKCRFFHKFYTKVMKNFVAW